MEIGLSLDQTNYGMSLHLTLFEYVHLMPCAKLPLSPKGFRMHIHFVKYGKGPRIFPPPTTGKPASVRFWKKPTPQAWFSGVPSSHRLRDDLNLCLSYVLPQIVHTGRQCRLEIALISFTLLSIAIRPVLPPVDVDHFLVVGVQQALKALAISKRSYVEACI
jgi:hypothetical protein